MTINTINKKRRNLKKKSQNDFQIKFQAKPSLFYTFKDIYAKTEQTLYLGSNGITIYKGQKKKHFIPYASIKSIYTTTEEVAPSFVRSTVNSENIHMNLQLKGRRAICHIEGINHTYSIPATNNESELASNLNKIFEDCIKAAYIRLRKTHPELRVSKRRKEALIIRTLFISLFIIITSSALKLALVGLIISFFYSYYVLNPKGSALRIEPRKKSKRNQRLQTSLSPKKNTVAISPENQEIILDGLEEEDYTDQEISPVNETEDIIEETTTQKNTTAQESQKQFNIALQETALTSASLTNHAFDPSPQSHIAAVQTVSHHKEAPILNTEIQTETASQDLTDRGIPTTRSKEENHTATTPSPTTGAPQNTPAPNYQSITYDSIQYTPPNTN